MKYLAFIIIFFFSFNTKSLLAQPHEYSVFSYRLNNAPHCQSLSYELSGLSFLFNKKKNNILNSEEQIEAPSWGVPIPDWVTPYNEYNDNIMVQNILNCLRDKNIINEKCGQNIWSSEKSRKKCLNKIKIHYEKKDKQRLKIEEKCIKKAKDMKTETAFNMMYSNCMKQNNY